LRRTSWSLDAGILAQTGHARGGTERARPLQNQTLYNAMALNAQEKGVRADAATEPGPRTADAWFEGVYRKSIGAITAYFARRTTDPQTVADLTSETFVRAIGSLAGFDPDRGTPIAWLIGIARHTSAAHLVASAQGHRTIERLNGALVLDEDATKEMAARIDDQRPGRAVLARLAELPDLERTALEYVDLAGLTPSEAADALSVSPGTLRVRLFRARPTAKGQDRWALMTSCGATS
jgi:RNA polymerase sigma factor (sigma-70 family)